MFFVANCTIVNIRNHLISFCIFIIFGFVDTYKKAQKLARKAEVTSHLESESDSDAGPRKRTRPNRSSFVEFPDWSDGKFLSLQKTFKTDTVDVVYIWRESQCQYFFYLSMLSISSMMAFRKSHV